MNRGVESELKNLGCVRSWIHSGTVREKELGTKKKERKEAERKRRKEARKIGARTGREKENSETVSEENQSERGSDSRMTRLARLHCDKTSR